MDWSQDNGLAQQRALTKLYERRRLARKFSYMPRTRETLLQAGDPSGSDQWGELEMYDDTSARALLGADIKRDAES